MRPRTLFALASIPLLLLAGCLVSGPGKTASQELLIVVNAPFSVSPAIGKTLYQGTLLAAREINDDGGVDVAGTRYRLGVEQVDNGLSPQKALDNVRQAIG